MREYIFTIHTGQDITLDQAHTIYEAGGYDALCSVINGRAQVSFSREAESLEAAIISAVAQLVKAGVPLIKFEIDFDLSDITKQ